MALTKIQIYNKAMAHIGHRQTIQSETEQSVERVILDRFYDSARTTTLEDFDWPFARTYLQLSDLGTPPSWWAYRYAYPADCIIPRFIVDPSSRSGTEVIAFEIAEYPQTGGVQCVLTDEATATLAYTLDVTDTSRFSGGYTNALSYKLAMDAAIPIGRDGRLQSALQQQYLFAIQQARIASTSGREGDTERNAEGSNELAEGVRINF